MIAFPPSVRVWLAAGHTDMRRGMQGLALQIQEGLHRGRFIWPVVKDGLVSLSPAQLGYMLEGIDWRNPQHTWRPQVAG
jgi:transposase